MSGILRHFLERGDALALSTREGRLADVGAADGQSVDNDCGECEGRAMVVCVVAAVGGTGRALPSHGDCTAAPRVG